MCIVNVKHRLTGMASVAGTWGERARLGDLLARLAAGVLLGALGVVMAVSVAAFIFVGDLSDLIGVGIGSALFSAMVLAGALALTSSYAGTIGEPQEGPAVLLSVILAGVVAHIGAEATPDTILSTIVVTLALAAALSGIVCMLLGRLRLGGVVQFAPYPVVGGVLAGLGWLLVAGAFPVMTGRALDLAQLDQLLAPEVIWKWMAGGAFAVILCAAVRWSSHSLTLPAFVFSALLLFAGAVHALGIGWGTLLEQGWLLGPFPESRSWPPLTTLPDPSWAAILAQWPGLTSLLLVTVIGLLLNASGIELGVRQDLDFDRELKGTGLANLISGAGGGLPGFHSLSRTLLAHRMAAPSRLIGLVVASISAIALFEGMTLFALLPRFLMGGLILFLGLQLLLEWLYDAASRLPRSDYAIIVVILLVTITVGYLEAIGVGIGLSIVLFTINYSRVEIVRFTGSGTQVRSTVGRPESARAILRAQGDEILVLRLQNYLFFGTAHRIVLLVRERIERADLPPLRHLIVDFRRVAGLDSSAAGRLLKIRQAAEETGFRIVLCGCASDVMTKLRVAGVLTVGDEVVRTFPDLDHGLEWCEEQMLEGRWSPEDARDMQPLAVRQGGAAFPPERLERVLGYMEWTVFRPGDHLVREGERSDEMYVIERGLVTVQLEEACAEPSRMRTQGPGTIVGELAMFLGLPRTASVIAIEPTEAWRLTQSALKRLEREEPELASALLEFVLREVSGRLLDNDFLLRRVLN
jgi:sulfate permease, SulP family